MTVAFDRVFSVGGELQLGLYSGAVVVDEDEPPQHERRGLLFFGVLVLFGDDCFAYGYDMELAFAVEIVAPPPVDELGLGGGLHYVGQLSASCQLLGYCQQLFDVHCSVHRFSVLTEGRPAVFRRIRLYYIILLI